MRGVGHHLPPVIMGDRLAQLAQLMTLQKWRFGAIHAFVCGGDEDTSEVRRGLLLMSWI